MDTFCLKKNCAEYDKEKNQCRILVQLQALHPNDEDGCEERETKLLNKGATVEKFLTKYPCELERHITHGVSGCSGVRGLSQQERDDLVCKVKSQLLKMDFRGVKQPLRPTYEDFKRYLNAIIRNEVRREVIALYGKCCCGTCVNFVEATETCTCAELKPLPGQQQVSVSSNTKPKDVLHYSMLFIGLDDIKSWPDFIYRLGRQGSGTTPSPGKRIWELLSQELREAIRNAGQNNRVAGQANGLPKTLKLSLIELLNDLLARPDFYDEINFHDLALDEEATELLGLLSGQNRLSNTQVRRLNRLLLEATFPEIAKGKPGCSCYDRRRFVQLEWMTENEATRVGLDELDRAGGMEKYRAEVALAKMESTNSRQCEQAMIIRLLSDGLTTKAIACRMKKHPNTISKLHYGTKETDAEEGMPYHQAGGREIFAATYYRGGLDDLKRAHADWWSAVTRRDFYTDKTQPSFEEIARELGIKRRQAIEWYKEGWNWIKENCKPLNQDEGKGG